MKNLLLALLIVLAVAPRAASQDADDRPNIIVFVSDDHRADVLGCAGHPVVRTPSIDGLAARGTRFANAYVTTSICAASRASILTGLPERAHGYTFGTAPLRASLAEGSYPARLKAAGYHTGFVGKFGVGVEGADETLGAMFDSFVPLTRTPYVKTLPDGTARHVTDITGDRAVGFVEDAPEGVPFCLSVSFNAGHAEDGDLEIHYPFPETEAGLYEGVEMPRPRLDDPAIFDAQPGFLKDSMNRDRYHWRWDTPEKYDRNLRNYYRMLSGMDRNIGRVLDAVEARGLTDRTVVVFIGDNGYYMGERGFAGKWSHYDESLRVPLVVVDPRSRADSRGRESEALALNLDIGATVLDAAGIRPGRSSPGVSLLPLARGTDNAPGREGFLCEHLMEHEAIPRWIGFRTERFKYARYLDDRGEFLHDLVTDPDELVNLAGDAAHAEMLEAMRDRTAAAAKSQARSRRDLPRVLLLGDSISMGYHNAVVRDLAGEADVVRPEENCAGTTKGLQGIDDWLAIRSGRFDVIHFNFGLHDLKRVLPNGRNSNDPADQRQAEPDDYERQLRAIVDKLRATGAELVFATTTPFPAGVRPYRDPEDAARYNAIARAIMDEHGIAIDDLYGFALPNAAEWMQPVNVHFSKQGSQELGAEVARSIRAAIKRR